MGDDIVWSPWGQGEGKRKRLIRNANDGAGPNRVAVTCEMFTADGKPDIEQAEQFIDDFFKAFPVLKQWLENQGRDAIRFGFTTSPKGRKRFYPMPAPDDPEKDAILKQIERWAGNHPIQAGNVDMLKPAMYGIYCDLRARGLSPEDARLLFVVHDEIVMTAKESLVPIVKEIMEINMMKAYKDIIGDVVINKIDVAIDTTWKKA